MYNQDIGTAVVLTVSDKLIVVLMIIRSGVVGLISCIAVECLISNVSIYFWYFLVNC